MRKKQRSYSTVLIKKHAVALSMSLFRLFFFIGMSFIILYPIITMLSSAFKLDTDVVDPSVIWIPKHFTLENMQQAFAALRYPSSLLTTVRISLVSAALQVISTMIIGYGFARFRFPGQKLLFVLVLLTIIVPTQVTMIPTYLNYHDFDIFGLIGLFNTVTGNSAKLNLLNNPLAMYLPAVFGQGIRAGLFIYIFRQSFSGMPKELDEAAMIDGCGPYKTFWRIMVPNIGAVLLTVTLFSMVWYWNDYYNTAMYMDNTVTITMALSKLRGFLWGNMNGVSGDDYYLTLVRMQAGALLCILPPLIVYFFVQKKFVQGVERSGIVG